jgi:hypothetical protein
MEFSRQFIDRFPLSFDSLFPAWLCGYPIKSLDFPVSQRMEMSRALATRPTHMSRRPSMAFSIVISSVYSMSLPTGIPIAMRVTLTPARLSCCER